MNPHEKIKFHLTTFWKQFGDFRYGRWTTSKLRRMSLLQDYARIVIVYSSRAPLQSYRSSFNREKYHLLALKEWDFCFVCGSKPDVRHHIIQLQNGGINSKRNLVSLCNRCHAEIHPHLNHIVPEVGKDSSERMFRKDATGHACGSSSNRQATDDHYRSGTFDQA